MKRIVLRPVSERPTRLTAADCEAVHAWARRLPLVVFLLVQPWLPMWPDENLTRRRFSAGGIPTPPGRFSRPDGNEGGGQ